MMTVCFEMDLLDSGSRPWNMISLITALYWRFLGSIMRSSLGSSGPRRIQTSLLTRLPNQVNGYNKSRSCDVRKYHQHHKGIQSKKLQYLGKMTDAGTKTLEVLNQRNTVSLFPQR